MAHFKMRSQIFLKTFLILSFTFFLIFANAQTIYVLHSRVKSFDAPFVLNYTSSSANLSSLQKKITILDFFGTWCIPCLKALPNLKNIQQQFKNDLSIVLISNEDDAKLKKFIIARNPFPFPLIVDNENKITNLFSPPSYPYTIVLNSRSEIIAITEAGSITPAMVNDWLAVKKDIVEEKPVISNTPAIMNRTLHSSNKLVDLSQQFIYAAKTGEAMEEFLNSLKNIAYKDLVDSLQTDDEKKAFWINIYNGYAQMSLKKNPDQYKHRAAFYKSAQVNIAGKIFSLDEIEHGILRRSKIKWSLGYLNKLFPGKMEKKLRVDQLDYRVHFALNCGAKSCPPIAFYNPENLNPQLNLATKAYLGGEAHYDSASNILWLPAIMGWFRHDFGGKKNMIKISESNGVLNAGKHPKVKFKKYDWALYLDNYKSL